MNTLEKLFKKLGFLKLQIREEGDIATKDKTEKRRVTNNKEIFAELRQRIRAGLPYELEEFKKRFKS